MLFQANILPGEGFTAFTIYNKKTGLTPSGRPTGGGIAETENRFYGILTGASQREVDQWKQNGHPITHKVTQQYAEAQAKATDYLKSEDGRTFYVQGTKNPAGLGVAMIYYVEERLDRKEVEV